MDLRIKEKIKISLILSTLFFVCVPVTEKENCQRWGCTDTENEFQVLSCPLYIGLYNLDCKNFSGSKYKTELECLQKKDYEKDGLLLSCLIGIRDTNRLNGKSEIPFSGGWCLFNC